MNATEAAAEDFNAALRLHQRGQLPEAQVLYERVLRLIPGHALALNLMGAIAGQSGDPRRAIDLIGRSIEIDPNDAGAHYNIALAQREVGERDAALASLGRAVATNPIFFEALCRRADLLLESGRWTEALESIDRAIALRPDFAEAHLIRGNALRELNQTAQALRSYDTAIAIQPDLADAYCNRGILQRQMLDFDAALDSYNRALAINPEHVEAHSNRGNVLRELDRLDEALASYDCAIALEANFAEAHSNRASALKDLNRLNEALEGFERALALQPDRAEFRANRSQALLLAGNFEDGWRDYEWRARTKYGWTTQRAAQLDSRPWRGETSLRGKTILLFSEQGLGDTLQFCRYATLVADLGATVVLQVPRTLASLMKTVEGVARVVIEGEARPDCEFNCPLMSLPLAFQTKLATIPSRIPYLSSDGPRVQRWAETLGVKARPRVGIVWSGGFILDQPEVWSVKMRRNVPLAKFAPLRHAEIEFYSLQKGQPAESELAELNTLGWDGPKLIDHTALLAEFADTAALIENLDLVISVDTAVAHLAGALGKPVWILNRFDTCWRWLTERVDSPWYPTARIFRQRTSGNWDDVILDVSRELNQFTGGGSPMITQSIC